MRSLIIWALVMAKKQPYLKQRYIDIQSSWEGGLSTPKKRAFANIDAHLGDHAFLRIFWRNLHEIAPNVWRSNQPSPKQIQRLSDMGIKTIINLRGPSRWGSYALEKEACKRCGITLVDHRLYSRRMPTHPELVRLKQTFESVEGPVLMHCKSGADRAGIGSALYLLLIQNTPIETAIKQLSFKYLHINHSNTGRLDFFLETYLAFNQKTPTPFLEWAEHHYDRDTLTAQYQSNKLLSWFVDRVLRRE